MWRMRDESMWQFGVVNHQGQEASDLSRCIVWSFAVFLMVTVKGQAL